MRQVVLWLALLAAASAQDAGQPGVVFETWVRDTFFDHYRAPAGAGRWEIPAANNTAHGDLPVHLALGKYGEPVDLGDALRQYEIDEPFLLVLGYWRLEGTQPRLTHLFAIEIRPEQWNRLWAPTTYNDLLKLDALIKDPAMPVNDLRRLVLKARNSPPFTQSIIQVNPKIGSDDRRALQCSIRFEDVFKHLATGADPQPQAQPALWGVPFPGPVAVPARSNR